MKYRSFGNSGWNISEVGFGAWASSEKIFGLKRFMMI